jgi:uncharacterized circularly permuted ATP-grasp superfamily protein
MSTARQSQSRFYDAQSFYDEMFDEHLAVRPHYGPIHSVFARLKPSELSARQARA